MQVAALSPATSHPPRGIFSSTTVLLESATCLFFTFGIPEKEKLVKNGHKVAVQISSIRVNVGWIWWLSCEPSKWEMGTGTSEAQMRDLALIHKVENDQDTYHIYRKEKKEENKRKGHKDT